MDSLHAMAKRDTAAFLNEIDTDLRVIRYMVQGAVHGDTAQGLAKIELAIDKLLAKIDAYE